MSFHCSSQLKKTKQKPNYVLTEKELSLQQGEYSISKRIYAGLWYLQIKSFSCRSHPTLIHKPRKVKGVFKSCYNFSKDIVSSTDVEMSLGYLGHPYKHLCWAGNCLQFSLRHVLLLPLFKQQMRRLHSSIRI